MIKVIAFDLDDTLWEVGPVIRRAESILAHWLEKEVPEYRYEPAKLMPIRETLLREDPRLGHRLTAFRQRLIEISLACVDNAVGNICLVRRAAPPQLECQG